MSTRIQLKRGTAAALATANPVLAAGELAWESDTNRLKSGDGVQPYGDLAYLAGELATPRSGLVITKTGGWSRERSAPFALFESPRAVQFGDTYSRYTGKWISVWSYTESLWSSVGGPRITALTFDDLEGVTGTLSLTSMAAITSLSFPVLAYVGGFFTPSNMAALTTLSVPALTYVVGNCGPTFMPALTTMSFPSLTFVGGNFGPGSAAALTTMSFPALEAVLGQVTIGNIGAMNSLTELSLPVLGYAGSSILLSNMATLATVSLPQLAYCNSTLTLSNLPAATTLSLPSLTHVGGITCTNLVGALANVTLPTDGTLENVGGNVSFTGNALTATSVDAVLQALASLDGTNGTFEYGAGRTVNISGGTTAAPTSLSTTTVTGSSFVCAGTTCTVTWTAHGYVTGDVLRISGVTTATNANRYAVITVVNANQFTYAITSQNATGSGTATVRLAGAAIKALVTRGVTLTTN